MVVRGGCDGGMMVMVRERDCRSPVGAGVNMAEEVKIEEKMELELDFLKAAFIKN